MDIYFHTYFAVKMAAKLDVTTWTSISTYFAGETLPCKTMACDFVRFLHKSDVFLGDQLSSPQTGLPDFSQRNVPKWENLYIITTKYTKWR
jgi:hypothetical protein